MGKAGFSLLETHIVLAVMALATALVLPRGGAALDRVTLHAVFFDFQRQVSDLRREAYRTQESVQIVAEAGDAAAFGSPRRIVLRTGWDYAFDAPMIISPGGVCGLRRVAVSRDGDVAMRLEAADNACHFTRVE